MTIRRFSGNSLDVILNQLYKATLRFGLRVHGTRELLGVGLELTNPLARLSRSSERGKAFSAIGEFAWYLSGTDDAGFIHAYIPSYPPEEEMFHMPGAYGPRLFGGDHPQVHEIIALLEQRPDSRQAVIQLFGHDDMHAGSPHLPCTCTIQFFVRENRVHVVTHMRSNDAWLGLPHDLFTFTMLQELVAKSLDCEVGTYRHFVGSMHIYERNVDSARRFTKDGFYAPSPMPEMPNVKPWPLVEEFSRTEEAIRNAAASEITLPTPALSSPYWNDLALMLAAFHSNDPTELEGFRSLLTEPSLSIYLQDLAVKRHKKREENDSQELH